MSNINDSEVVRVPVEDRQQHNGLTWWLISCPNCGCNEWALESETVFHCECGTAFAPTKES